MKLRKFLALAVVFVMVFALLAACNGNDDNGGGGDNGGDSQVDERRYANTRTIEVAIWWDTETIPDSNRRTPDPDASNPVVEQMRLDKMRSLEDKFNIRFEFVDMTFAGVRESINTSIMAGTPDVDVYCVDLQWAVPLVLNNLCLPVRAYAPEDSDMFSVSPKVMSTVNIAGNADDFLLRPASPGSDIWSLYSLGFNKDILDEFSQPCPQDLWDEGRWTWDAWMDIMRAVTDSGRGTYGYGGAFGHDLGYLLMSNGAGIALTDQEGLTSGPTLQVLNLIFNMYNVDRVARPYDETDYWNSSSWSDGNIAFFPWVTWRAQGQGITRGFAWGSYEESQYVIRNVHWPVGPSGNRDTNAMQNLNGNVFMIPTHTIDPDIVFEVFYGFHNWYDYDLSIRDDEMSEADYYGDDERGFQYALEMVSRPQFDMYVALGVQNADGDGFSVYSLIAGEEIEMVSQFTEGWRNVLQDYIDVAYGKR